MAFDGSSSGRNPIGSRLRARFSRLSSGLKMLLILSAALLPLGMIALFA